jgi:hypothetical protein
MKETLKLALEAVKELHRTGDTQVFDMYYAQPVIKALKEALAKQEQGEPVAWRFQTGTFWNREVHWRYVLSLEGTEGLQGLEPLYTTPQQRTWVGLTDEEIWQTAMDCTIGGDLHADKFAKAIEAKLKEKNT